jgi:hypothetical protein
MKNKLKSISYSFLLFLVFSGCKSNFNHSKTFDLQIADSLMYRVQIDSTRSRGVMPPYIAFSCNFDYKTLNTFEYKVYNFLLEDSVMSKYRLKTDFMNCYRQYVILKSEDSSKSFLMIHYTLLLNGAKLRNGWSNVVGIISGEFAKNVIQYSVYCPIDGKGNLSLMRYKEE